MAHAARSAFGERGKSLKSRLIAQARFDNETQDQSEE
jgi:hypothetical protein